MHFIALCHRYPQFQFVVSALRNSTAKRATVKFENGLLDTRNSGYAPEQADAILAVLKSMRQTPPLFGTDITVRTLDTSKEK